MNRNVKIEAETQIQNGVGTLLDAAADRNHLVCETVKTSLKKIAKKHPNEVLKTCCQYYDKNPKLTPTHSAAILAPLEDICRDNIALINEETVITLAKLCLHLMTQNTFYEPSVQLTASGIIVALGTKYCEEIINELLTKIELGVVPHYTIPHTLGSLAYTNALGVVPFLKKILEIFIPLLTHVKTDTIRQAFAFALGKFAFALTEYLGNLDQENVSIKLEDFHVEMSASFNILFTVWLNSKEIKVVETVLNALEQIFTVLSSDKVRELTVKTVHFFLNLNKKHKLTHAVTKCLGSVITVAAKVDGTLLEPLLQPILQVLSELICIFPDYAQPDLLRTHTEVLRCYECLALHFTDHTLDHLLAQLKSNAERDKVKALIVLTHLINSAQVAIKNRLKDILLVILMLTNENSLKIKRALMKTIVALAYRGFLTGEESLRRYLEFIVRLCCKSCNMIKESEQQDYLELQQSADNMIYMLCTSIKELERPLWDLLLQCFLSLEYTDATITILKCLGYIASKENIQENNISAFIRCLSLLSQPLLLFQGNYVLNFMKNIRVTVESSVKPVWDMKIQHLLKYLESNYENFNEKEWNEMIFDFLTLSLQIVKDVNYKNDLISKIKEQLLLYSIYLKYDDFISKNLEKRILLKSLAIVSCYVSEEKIVLEILDIILQSIRLCDIQELQSCSEAIGTISRTHFLIVMEKLANIRKEVIIKKNKFFSFMKDSKNEAELERVRYVVISSYAEICNEAPNEELMQKIESEILNFVLNELVNCKDFTIRSICLKTIGAVADAMHPSRNKLLVMMQEKERVLSTVSSQIQLHNGPEYIELFPIILPVLTSLIKLPHVLESEQRLKLLKLCFDNIFNASAVYCKMSLNSFGDLKLSQYVHSSFSKLNILIQELLLQSISPATLDEIVTLLEAWLGKKKPEQRLPALEALRIALQTYLDNMKFAYEGPTTFTQTGLLLGRIVPRCTDSNRTIRKVAVESVCLVLCISSRYEGHMRDNDKILYDALSNVRENIETEEPKLLFNLTNDLANVIAENIPKYQLGHFIESLLDGLIDVETSSSNGASVVLNKILKLKGEGLLPYAHDVTIKILGLMKKMKCSRTRSTSLRAIHSFAGHHLRPILSTLLMQPLPYDQEVCDCFAVISNDAILVGDVVEQLKKTIRSGPLYEELPSTDGLKIATLIPLQAVCALCEVFKQPQCTESCKQQFAEIFSTLLIVLASYINTAAPAAASLNTNERKEKYTILVNTQAYKINPAKICAEAFRLFLSLCENSNGANLLMLCDTSYMNSYLEMVPKLADSICMENSQSLAWLVATLGPYSRSDFEPQRIAVIAFFSSVLKHKLNEQTVLTENILEMLLDVQSDSSPIVKQLSLRGLGYAAEHLSHDFISRYCSGILNALLQGLNYQNISLEFQVTLEAMHSLSKLLKVAEKKYLGQCQVTAAVRIKPFLEQDNCNLRSASFRLLGDLAVSIGLHEEFQEQVNGNLIPLLLHLRDEDIQVVKACKYTLRMIASFLGSDKFKNMIHDHVLEEANLHYVQFIMDLVKVMAEDAQELFPQLIMTCLSHFKSPWVEIRSYAALLSGLLFSNLTEENKTQVSMDTITYRLLQLLKDEQAEVRARAVEAIAYVFIT